MIWSFLRYFQAYGCFPVKATTNLNRKGFLVFSYISLQIRIVNMHYLPIVSTMKYQNISMKRELPNIVHLHICVKRCLCYIHPFTISCLHQCLCYIYPQIPTSCITEKSIAVWSILGKLRYNKVIGDLGLALYELIMSNTKVFEVYTFELS